MQIAILGAGWVGVTTAAALAKMGHTVLCSDIDEAKVQRLNRGDISFFEPGLTELVREGIAAERLRFVSSNEAALHGSVAAFSCVNTPSQADGSANVSALTATANDFARHHEPGAVFVIKSTVPPGTCEKMRAVIATQSTKVFFVAANPEFLAESTAVRDVLTPHRLIVGSDDAVATEVLRQVFKPFVDQGTSLVETDCKSAEVIKCAANSYLATRISFMNEVANYCEAIGANAADVALGIGLDPRIGKVRPGIGYGGGCFPKDVRSLLHEGRQAEHPLTVLEAAHAVNEAQGERLFKRLQQAMGNLQGKRIAVWGLAFKPNTDDIRVAPAVIMVERLIAAGAHVVAYDPKVKSLPSVKIEYAPDALSAAAQADALMLLTEWAEFSDISLTQLAEQMSGKVLADGRYFWSKKEALILGFLYLC